MHMRRLVQLAMSGVLVLGSFAFAEEPDWTGRSQQEREADSSDSGTKTPRNRQSNRLFSRRQPRQDRPNNQERRAALRLLLVCLEGRDRPPVSPRNRQNRFPRLPRASSPALPANSPVQDQVRGFCASARILATCPFGRVIPSGFACCPLSGRIADCSGAGAGLLPLTGTGRPLRGSGEKTPWRNSAKHSARPMPRQRRS